MIVSPHHSQCQTEKRNKVINVIFIWIFVFYQLVLNLSERLIDGVHDIVDIYVPVTQLLAPELTRRVEFMPEVEVTWPD